MLHIQVAVGPLYSLIARYWGLGVLVGFHGVGPGASINVPILLREEYFFHPLNESYFVNTDPGYQLLAIVV